MPVRYSESSANGRHSGSEIRITIGWTRFSYWLARIMYMNTIDSPNATTNWPLVRSNSRPVPRTLTV